MKTKTTKIISLLALAIVTIGYQSCKKDDFPKPVASSQARFTYQIDTIMVNDVLEAFEVQFFNHSVLAKSYHWDFGNGQTSTEANPSCRYESQGRFNVKLTINSDNDLYYNKLVDSVQLKLILKLILINEPFNGPADQVDDTWLPEGWLAIDADGDNYNWYWGLRTVDGQASMRSQSWDSQTSQALTPDNFLITKELDLTAMEEGEEVWVTFNVCPTASTAIYKTEHYGVFVSTSGTNPEDFTEMVWDETLLQTTPSWVYQLREIELTQFAGEKIRIAFRHYNSTDKDRIVIDNVEVYLSNPN
jgi:PKD repeat protein